MAIIDVHGYVADLKDHLTDHQFHVHDERHFVETYSMRQTWEIDLHPDQACEGPLVLHLAIELDPRVLLTFEDQMLALPEDADPPTGFSLPLLLTWELPPLSDAPDLLVLATDLAGLGGQELPLKVQATDSTYDVTDAAERTFLVASKVELGLDDLFMHRENMCDIFERCFAVSDFLLQRAPAWLDEI